MTISRAEMLAETDAVAADGDAVAGQVDGTFHAAVDVKRFRAGDFSLDDQ